MNCNTNNNNHHASVSDWGNASIATIELDGIEYDITNLFSPSKSPVGQHVGGGGSGKKDSQKKGAQADDDETTTSSLELSFQKTSEDILTNSTRTMEDSLTSLSLPEDRWTNNNASERDLDTSDKSIDFHLMNQSAPVLSLSSNYYHSGTGTVARSSVLEEEDPQTSQVPAATSVVTDPNWWMHASSASFRSIDSSLAEEEEEDYNESFHSNKERPPSPLRLSGPVSPPPVSPQKKKMIPERKAPGQSKSDTFQPVSQHLPSRGRPRPVMTRAQSQRAMPTTTSSSSSRRLGSATATGGRRPLTDAVSGPTVDSPHTQHAFPPPISSSSSFSRRHRFRSSGRRWASTRSAYKNNASSAASRRLVPASRRGGGVTKSNSADTKTWSCSSNHSSSSSPGGLGRSHSRDPKHPREGSSSGGSKKTTATTTLLKSRQQIEVAPGIWESVRDVSETRTSPYEMITLFTCDVCPPETITTTTGTNTSTTTPPLQYCWESAQYVSCRYCQVVLSNTTTPTTTTTNTSRTPPQHGVCRGFTLQEWKKEQRAALMAQQKPGSFRGVSNATTTK